MLLTTWTPTQLSSLSLHDALPIFLPAQGNRRARRPTARELPLPHRGRGGIRQPRVVRAAAPGARAHTSRRGAHRSEEHTSELQSRRVLVCRLLLEKNKRDSCCILS